MRPVATTKMSRNVLVEICAVVFGAPAALAACIGRAGAATARDEVRSRGRGGAAALDETDPIDKVSK